MLLGKQNNHSKMKTYPIDTQLFPLTKKVNFIEYNLTENQFLFVPNFWPHWVFTDPYTLSFHYKRDGTEPEPHIPELDYTDLFYENVKKQLPFTGEGLLYDSFSMNDFLQKNKNQHVNVFYSKEDFSPVLKEGQTKNTKYFNRQTILDLHETLDRTPKYCMYNEFSSGMEIYGNKDIKSVVNSDILMDYNPTIWFTLEHRTDSGIHHDPGHSIIYVRTGRKKILLVKPSQIPYLYMEYLPSVT